MANVRDLLDNLPKPTAVGLMMGIYITMHDLKFAQSIIDCDMDEGLRQFGADEVARVDRGIPLAIKSLVENYGD